MDEIPKGKPITRRIKRLMNQTHMFTPGRRHILCGATGELVATINKENVKCKDCLSILAQIGEEYDHSKWKAKEQNDTTQKSSEEISKAREDRKADRRSGTA